MPLQKKWKSNCRLCRKEFEYEYKDHEPFFCSTECHIKHSEKIYYERIGKIIPLKFQSIICDNKDLVDSLKNEESLFITGKIGVGKTVLMATLIKEILKQKFNDVQWISYLDFIMRLQSAFRDETQNPYQIAKETAAYEGVLAIDDLGAEKLTDFVRQITYYILNEREQRVLPTMITSNFSLQEIDEQIDPRVSSRIAGIYKIIQLEGKDKRLKNANQKGD